MTKICIIGCGTYGSYLLKRLLDSFDDCVSITVIEIGNKNIKTEEEIGIYSESNTSSASHLGRYFGLGGTSARWGGQLLFFDNRDNLSQDSDWKHIISVNKKYKRKVLENLLGQYVFDDIQEEETNIKSGIWLKYSSRNIFKKVNKNKLKNVKLIENHRVVDFVIENNRITEVKCANLQGEIIKVEADNFYLTAGALESCRLLMELNKKYTLFTNNSIGKNIGDHLSLELFKINNSKPIINNTDFSPRFYRGSLITKRMIVYGKNGRIGYIHPIFNRDVRIFSSIKNMLFGRQKIAFKFGDILNGIFFLCNMLWSIIIHKKMYVDKKSWSLQLDIEQAFPNENQISVINNKDRFSQNSIKIDWQISNEDYQVIEEIKDNVYELLNRHKFDFSPMFEKLTVQKIEDAYHPVGFLKMSSLSEVLDLNCQVNNVINLFHFSTAIFSSAKTINPTAAVFCFIEDHLQKNFFRND